MYPTAQQAHVSWETVRIQASVANFSSSHVQPSTGLPRCQPKKIKNFG